MSTTDFATTCHAVSADWSAAIRRCEEFPRVRFMGSKHRLMPWIAEVVSQYSFRSVLDAFSGSGVVAYLFKAAGKRVVTNDFLNLGFTFAHALVENSTSVLTSDDLAMLLDAPSRSQDFIERTFSGIFYTIEDLRFLDEISANIRRLSDEYKRSLALTALVRSCIKRQPRGVFTVGSSEAIYDDGRRDLRLSLREHFVEQVAVYNDVVFANGKRSRALMGDVFDIPISTTRYVDLVYLDPPYVPRSDDNDYIKRYHFVEGLVRYWEGMEILQNSKVKKIKKRFTPFAYRRHAVDAFSALFRQFRRSTLVLSYSSNGYPDLDELVSLMRTVKGEVEVYRRQHRYHFGTHANVKRAKVDEYLVVGR